MLRQYHASPFRIGAHGRPIGTIPVGEIVYIQEPRSLRAHGPLMRGPWIVEAWLPRDCMGKRMRGGHLAQVRNLATGRRIKVADWLLRRCTDAAGP